MFVLLLAVHANLAFEGHAACIKTRQQARPAHASSSVLSQWLSTSIWIKCDRAAVAWRRRHEEAATRESYQQQLVPDRLWQEAGKGYVVIVSSCLSNLHACASAGSC
jgi:hypothetical protein